MTEKAKNERTIQNSFNRMDAEAKQQYLQRLSGILQILNKLSLTLRQPSETNEHDMQTIISLIEQFTKMTKDVVEERCPFNCVIPNSLLEWLDKPMCNNPNLFLNECLKMCERYNNAYLTRREAANYIVTKLETELAEYL